MTTKHQVGKMEIYNDNNEASFNRVLKVIQDWIDFALVCSLIGPETRATLSTMPVRCKINNNHDLLARVFPLFRRFSCFTSSSHWVFRVFFVLLISLCDNFGFRFYDSYSKGALIDQERTRTKNAEDLRFTKLKKKAMILKGAHIPWQSNFGPNLICLTTNNLFV